MRIDDFMPVWHFREAHSAHVNASPEAIFAATHAVTANEIVLFRTLTAIRRLGPRAQAGILNPPGNEPLLDFATRSTFRYLADDAPREIVVGTRVARGVEVTMNFRIDENGRLSTETRVYAPQTRARIAFGLYWLLIRPGSGFIRRMWLRAIKKRAER